MHQTFEQKPSTQHHEPRTLNSKHSSGLTRQMGLLGLASTGIVPCLAPPSTSYRFMIQRNVPGIGPDVLAAFIFAAGPAILAAFAYSILHLPCPVREAATSMRAGACILILDLLPASRNGSDFQLRSVGVVRHRAVWRDIATALGWNDVAAMRETGSVRVALALIVLWFFVWVNIRGVKIYERTVIPLMFLMLDWGPLLLLPGSIMIILILLKHYYLGTTGPSIHPVRLFPSPFFLSASAVLSQASLDLILIAQAGGEAKNPQRSLPLAIGIAVVAVGSFTCCLPRPYIMPSHGLSLLKKQ